MCPPFSLYLAALFRRFTTTCSSRVGSTLTQRFPRSIETSSVCFRSSTSGLTVAAALSRIGVASSTSLRSSILPRLMRETSSRSSMSRVRCFICRVMTSIDQSICSLRPAPGGHADGVADGGERVPQLVGEHGEELVLALVVRPQLVVEPRVLDGDGGEPRELHEDGLVVGRELALVLVRELEEPHALAVAADERGGEPAVHGRNRQGDLFQRLPSRVAAQFVLGQANGLFLRVHHLVKFAGRRCRATPAQRADSRRSR